MSGRVASRIPLKIAPICCRSLALTDFGREMRHPRLVALGEFKHDDARVNGRPIAQTSALGPGEEPEASFGATARRFLPLGHSNIEGVGTFPFAEMVGVGVPLVVFELEIGRAELNAERFFQRFVFFELAKRIQ